ncbi:hypothetical protein [Actinoplanes sp. G11-F43]|uniref:hypothetical protein n=1 Tax=Actinoplanes sp. G11-F43 TaxID=3424130 RepID=UPI003D3316DC
MTQPRKRPRLLTVDGVVYRWRIRRRPAMAGPLAFAVERADRPGTVLLATTPARLTDSPGTPLPALVAALIREARAAGWRPESRGPAFPLSANPDVRSH